MIRYIYKYPDNVNDTNKGNSERERGQYCFQMNE